MPASVTSCYVCGELVKEREVWQDKDLCLCCAKALSDMGGHFRRDTGRLAERVVAALKVVPVPAHRQEEAEQQRAAVNAAVMVRISRFWDLVLAEMLATRFVVYYNGVAV